MQSKMSMLICSEWPLSEITMTRLDLQQAGVPKYWVLCIKQAHVATRDGR